MFGFIGKAMADTSGDASAATAALLVGGGLIFVWIIIAIIALIGLILWIWALVNCLKKEFPGNDKTTWIVVLIVSFFLGFGWLGAIIYLIVGRSKGHLPINSHTEVKAENTDKKEQKQAPQKSQKVISESKKK